MGVLIVIFIIGVLLSLNILQNKKIKNLLVLTMIFCLLVGCNSTDNKSSVETSSSKVYSTSKTEELSDTENEEYDNSEKGNDDEKLVSKNNEEISENNDSDNQTNNHYENNSDNNSNEYEDSSSEHIGETVYIANGNSYYHKISNCKYLEGAKTKKVVLSSDIDKYECNCFTNPVEYKSYSGHHSTKHHTNKHNSNKKSSSGQKVYVANGNSYYHKSSNCKFIKGANVRKVDIGDVEGKHPCNCIKY